MAFLRDQVGTIARLPVRRCIVVGRVGQARSQITCSAGSREPVTVSWNQVNLTLLLPIFPGSY
jgi:hypothetical protein